MRDRNKKQMVEIAKRRMDLSSSTMKEGKRGGSSEKYASAAQVKPVGISEVYEEEAWSFADGIN